MIIRTLLPEDLIQLREIAKTAVNASVEAPSANKQEIVTGIYDNLAIAISSPQSGAFLVSENKDHAQGFILIKNYWNLSDLFVSPSHHGEGIGQALWTAALKICETNSERNSIRVNSSLNAVTFYESLEFYKIEREKKHPAWIVPLERKIKGRSQPHHSE